MLLRCYCKDIYVLNDATDAVESFTMTSHTQYKIVYRCFRFLKALFVLLVKISASAVGVLASAANTSQESDQHFENLRGGVLNYRTGKLDDGTDPFGWYEDD